MRISNRARSPALTRLTISESGRLSTSIRVPCAAIRCNGSACHLSSACRLSWEEAHMDRDRLTTPWWALRIVLGAAAFLAGLDKFFNLLADWPGYLSPLAIRVIPMSPSGFMHIVGVIEMVVGALILVGFTQLGGYIAAVWLLCIAVNLVTTGRYFDIAVRDIALAVSAFTLARLTEAGVTASTAVPHGGRTVTA